MNSVLVLDGCQRSALAVVRSLGRHGVSVFAADAGDRSLAGSSRYCAGHLALPAPTTAADEYPDAVLAAARARDVDLVIPVTDASTMLLAPLAGRHAEVSLATPPGGAYARLSDKARLVGLAVDLGVPVPETKIARSRDELLAAAEQIGYPCVLKPACSRVRDGRRLIATSVSRATSPAELEGGPAMQWLEQMPILVQAFIPGHGAGVFSLYGSTGPVAWFAHRRLREKPPAGGVSVLCESAPVDADMRGDAERLLTAAEWFGPAMVEFRVDPEGQPWLMEVNGRFWGSLQLAIDCGVDFPWLLVQLCRGEAAPGPESYEVGRRLRWLLGDLDHLLLQLRGKGTAATIGAKLACLGRFMNFFDPRTRLEVLRRDDPRPFRHELGKWLRALGPG